MAGRVGGGFAIAGETLRITDRWGQQRMVGCYPCVEDNETRGILWGRRDRWDLADRETKQLEADLIARREVDLAHVTHAKEQVELVLVDPDAEEDDCGIIDLIENGNAVLCACVPKGAEHSLALWPEFEGPELDVYQEGLGRRHAFGLERVPRAVLLADVIESSHSEEDVFPGGATVVGYKAQAAAKLGECLVSCEQHRDLLAFLGHDREPGDGFKLGWFEAFDGELEETPWVEAGNFSLRSLEMRVQLAGEPAGVRRGVIRRGCASPGPAAPGVDRLGAG